MIYDLSYLNIMENSTCRICGNIADTILDLGRTPLANSLVDKETKEDTYELKLQYCENCGNFQLSQCIDNELLYSNYLYQTPNSELLDTHYNNLLTFFKKNNYLNENTTCLEIGCNKGQLLDKIAEFIKCKPVGIDPAENILKQNNYNNVNYEINFFNKISASSLVKKYSKFNLIIARHCFAHNERPHDILEALQASLTEDGLFVIENPYTLNTILNGEFDQIYHEHMYFYTIKSLKNLLKQFDYEIIDSFIAPVHGGSIVAICGSKNTRSISHSHRIYEDIENIMLSNMQITSFTEQVNKTILNLRNIIKTIKKENKSIFCYGATAKGNTLLNTCKFTNKDIDYCVDSTQIKIGKFLPGSKIEIISEEQGTKNPPDFYLLTAWNYSSEIISKVRASGNYSTKFIIPYPNPHIIS